MGEGEDGTDFKKLQQEVIAAKPKAGARVVIPPIERYIERSILDPNTKQELESWFPLIKRYIYSILDPNLKRELEYWFPPIKRYMHSNLNPNLKLEPES